MEQATIPNPTQSHGKYKKLLFVLGGICLIISSVYIIFMQNKEKTSGAEHSLTNNQILKESFVTFLKNEIEKEKQDPNVKHTTTYNENDIQCVENRCSVIIRAIGVLFEGPFKFVYVYENGAWVADKTASAEQDNDVLTNEYHLCVSLHQNAVQEVSVNNKSIKSFYLNNHKEESISTCSPLVLNPGNNSIVITFTLPTQEEQQLVYSYELRGFPKGDPEGDGVFNDEYILFSSKKDGLAFGVGEIVQGNKVIMLNFEAK